MEIGLQSEFGLAVTAVAHGAMALAKNSTPERADGGVNTASSLDFHELSALVTGPERAWQSLGRVQYDAAEAEKASACLLRSRYIAAEMKAEDVLVAENLRVVRSGYGLTPKYYALLLGWRVNRDVERGTAVDWQILAWR